MGAKDMTVKYLESYNDVFSDIVNVLLFQGKRGVQPGQLANSRERAIYKADDVPHEEERDILKFWKKNRVCIAVYGFENQTQVDKTMPLRIMGYDGASYREQILKDKQEKKCPVITIVLYFGTERPWRKPLRLSECFHIPEDLKPYFSDYEIHVFRIAFLPEETIRQFQSDFRIVADYFSQVRKNKNYIPSKKTMKHVDAVLKLMSVMTGDYRFEAAQKAGEVHTMCEVMDRVEQNGIRIGMRKGEHKGMRKGLRKGQMDTLVSLVNDGLLAVSEAAKRAGLSEADFETFLKKASV